MKMMADSLSEMDPMSMDAGTKESSMMQKPMQQAVRRHRSILAAAVVGVLVMGWYLFRPELLFVNMTVQEALPTNGTVLTKPTAEGMFHSAAHETKGNATIYQLAGGERVLRLTGFETSNGPDVHVLLGKAADAKDNDAVKSAGYVDLGSLKGNIGDQNYTIPTDVDLAAYNSVTIWCNRFSVNFGTAPLTMN
jgi:hypothetical protein